VAAEAEESHGLDKMLDDVCIPPDGRRRPDQAADGMSLGSSSDLAVPLVDGVGGDADDLGEIADREVEDAPEPDDAEALLWRVVGSIAVGDLVPARPEEADQLLVGGEACLQLLDGGLGDAQRIGLGPEVDEPVAEEQAQECVGVEQGLAGQVEEALAPARSDEEAIAEGFVKE
jgi:hypothetical protein